MRWWRGENRRSEQPEVQAAFADVPREHFLPPEQRRYAAEDRPLPIGAGQTNSQPTTVRIMLGLLAVRPGEAVLDVGCGSGWTAALLGRLVGPDGRVVARERVPELAQTAADNLAALGMPWVQVGLAPANVLGAPEQGPYDRILVSAAAGRLPQPLVDQLAAPGRLVAPVGRRLSVVDRLPDGEVRVRRTGQFRFVPLIWEE